MSRILRHDLTKKSRVPIFVYCLIRIKELSVRKFEGFTHSKILGILQTEMIQSEPQLIKDFNGTERRMNVSIILTCTPTTSTDTGS